MKDLEAILDEDLSEEDTMDLVNRSFFPTVSQLLESRPLSLMSVKPKGGNPLLKIS
jgi:hypothetical protein